MCLKSGGNISYSEFLRIERRIERLVSYPLPIPGIPDKFGVTVKNIPIYLPSAKSLEFGPEVVPELIREMGSPANPAGGIPGSPGIRESSEEPGF